jgi:hypothetical protein
MNFPLELPIFQFLFWLVNTAGVGGFLVALVGGGSLLTYGLTLYWITRGGKDEDDTEIYTYPTPALHAHHEE